MATTVSSPPSESRSARDWLKQADPLHNPALWIPVLVIAAVVIYHLVWIVSGAPYSVAALTTIISGVLVVLLLAALGRGRVILMRATVRFFLSIAGFAASVLGISTIIGSATIGGRTTTDVVGSLLLLAGLFVFAAGVYLRGEGDRPGAFRPFLHVTEQRDQLAGAEAVLRRFRGYGGGGTDRIVDVCKGFMSSADLHYVAYWMDGKPRFTLDVLDEKALDGYFERVNRDDRREEYLRHAQYLDKTLTGLNDSFHRIDSGNLLRIVLDVQRGALYYFWVDDERFIIGVTLDQSQVMKADQRLVALVNMTRESLGHRKIEDLNT